MLEKVPQSVHVVDSLPWALHSPETCDGWTGDGLECVLRLTADCWDRSTPAADTNNQRGQLITEGLSSCTKTVLEELEMQASTALINFKEKGEET